MFVNAFKNTYSSEGTSTGPCQNPSTTRRGTKAPRPKNAFMLYRQAVHGYILARNVGLHNKHISKIAGDMWRNECSSVQKYFERLADEEKLKHSHTYPGYKYQPRRRRKSIHVAPHCLASDRATPHRMGSSCSRQCSTPLSADSLHCQTLDMDSCFLSSLPSQCLDDETLQAFIGGYDFNLLIPL